MSEAITALITAVLTFLAQEMRQNIKNKNSTDPPPPDSDMCKRCFFFKEFSKTIYNKK